MQAPERFRFVDFPRPLKLLTGALVVSMVLLMAAGVLGYQLLSTFEVYLNDRGEAVRPDSTEQLSGEEPLHPAEAARLWSGAYGAVLGTALSFGGVHTTTTVGHGTPSEHVSVDVRRASLVKAVQRYRFYLLLLIGGIVLLFLGAWTGMLRQFSYYFAERQHAMQTISESETRNIALLHALPDTIFLIDRDGTFLDFHARNEMAGLSGSKILGMNVRDVLPADVAARAMQAVDTAVETDDTQSFEYVIRDEAAPEAGAEQHFEARIVSCWGDRALAIVRNITEREQAERAIREAESKFRILVEQSLTGIYIIQDGRFTYVNPRFADIFGYTPEEVMALSDVSEIVVPEDRLQVWEQLFPEQGGAGAHAHYLIRGLRKDGGAVYAEVYGSRTAYRGRPAVIGTLLDVTEQHEAQEKLRVLGMAVEQSAEGVLVIDPNGVVCFVNPAWARMHGWTVEEVTGKHFRIFHTEEQMRREVFPAINRFDRMRIYRAEMGHKRKDGSTFPSSTAFASLRDPGGNMIGAVGICRDITEQKQYEAELLAAKERAEEMARMKSAFLTNMSHEIRTPLTGILGFAAVLEEEVPGDQREFAQLIRLSGERLMRTLNAVLDLARLEAGEMVLAPRPVNLRQEIEAASSLFHVMADEKALAFSIRVENTSLQARIDPNALNMILSNLVGNAIKFTDAGEVRVEVAASEHEVCMRVVDTGVGIDAAFLPHLFQEFEQESAGLTRSHEGSGLGLSITKRLVELMGGRIDVQSRKGEGSVFTVTFPRYVAEPALPNVA